MDRFIARSAQSNKSLIISIESRKNGISLCTNLIHPRLFFNPVTHVRSYRPRRTRPSIHNLRSDSRQPFLPVVSQSGTVTELLGKNLEKKRVWKEDTYILAGSLEITASVGSLATSKFDYVKIVDESRELEQWRGQN